MTGRRRPRAPTSARPTRCATAARPAGIRTGASGGRPSSPPRSRRSRQHGPDALTAQIAELAGVPRTHVYRHFDGKQALDLAVSRHVARQIGESDPRRAGRPGSAARDHRRRDRASTWAGSRRTRTSTASSPSTPTPWPPPARRRADDAKAAFAAELTALLARLHGAFDLDDAPAERVIIGVVGMVDPRPPWWLEHPRPPRADTHRPAHRADVAASSTAAARELGLALDRDDALLLAATGG